ncbi:50S ribosomal protein L27 [Patescibacteria group bacterium]|nr:50S ribosomal protein L27 [Patescibacteria group bacterium]MBU1034618.1 50S ribosomal protein L27 [Patescibacteria group bacterium]MBU1629497.1 50S ribosomal protein L27 [Patescibacteria group bacterium]MBU1907666.1 50S ribosomal protein L27 [Patescibacteria group bacterium]
MAHKKAGGSTSYGRDSQGQRLGTKLYGGEYANSGAIIVRQRGSKIRAGKNVRMGSDDTLYAAVAGIVKFTQKKIRRYTGKLKKAKFVNIEPIKAEKILE